MATIKSHSDLKQSKKLAEFLPMESADMYYRDWKRATKDIRIAHVGTAHKKDLPCWSLAALLGILPNYNIVNNGITGVVAWSLGTYSNEHHNLIDSCVDLILKLHKQNLL